MYILFLILPGFLNAEWHSEQGEGSHFPSVNRVVNGIPQK